MELAVHPLTPMLLLAAESGLDVRAEASEAERLPCQASFVFQASPRPLVGRAGYVTWRLQPVTRRLFLNQTTMVFLNMEHHRLRPVARGLGLLER